MNLEFINLEKEYNWNFQMFILANHFSHINILKFYLYRNNSTNYIGALSYSLNIH